MIIPFEIQCRLIGRCEDCNEMAHMRFDINIKDTDTRDMVRHSIEQITEIAFKTFKLDVKKCTHGIKP